MAINNSYLTPEQTATLNTIRKQNAGAFSADDIQETSPLAFADRTADTSSISSIFDMTASAGELARLQDEQFKRDEKKNQQDESRLAQAEDTQDTYRSNIEKLMADRPNTRRLLEEGRAEFGVDEDLGLLRSLTPEVAALRTRLAQLTTEGQLAVEAEAGQGRGIPLTIVRGAQAKVQRQYAIRQAGVAAELGAKAATIQALQGNIGLAEKLINSAIDAEVYDFTQQLQDYNDLYDMNQDVVNNLDAKTKEFLDRKRNDLKTELANKRQTMQQVGQLHMEYPTAGILLTDTLEEAQQKVAMAGGTYAARKAAKALGDSGELGGSIQLRLRNIASGLGIAPAEIATVVDSALDLMSYFADPNNPTLEEQTVATQTMVNAFPQIPEDSIRKMFGLNPVKKEKSGSKKQVSGFFPTLNPTVQSISDNLGTLSGLNRIVQRGSNNWYKKLRGESEETRRVDEFINSWNK